MVSVGNLDETRAGAKASAVFPPAPDLAHETDGDALVARAHENGYGDRRRFALRIGARHLLEETAVERQPRLLPRMKKTTRLPPPPVLPPATSPAHRRLH